MGKFSKRESFVGFTELFKRLEGFANWLWVKTPQAPGDPEKPFKEVVRDPTEKVPNRF